MSPAPFGRIAGYVALNLVYTFRLKRVVIIDVFCIAAFFVFRLLAGTTAIAVKPSVWLLLCGGLLALYLGFARRRNELLLVGEERTTHRSVLSEYSAEFLNQVSIVLLSTTVISYVMYTLNSATKVVLKGALLFGRSFAQFRLEPIEKRRNCDFWRLLLVPPVIPPGDRAFVIDASGRVETEVVA